jgi:hypothetical protein
MTGFDWPTRTIVPGYDIGTVSQIIESSLLCRGWAWQKVTLYMDDRWRPKWGVCMKMPKNDCRQLPDFLLMFGPLLCQCLFVLKNEVRQFQIKIFRISTVQECEGTNSVVYL